MQSFEQLFASQPGFEFPTQFCLAGTLGRSTICFHNFYDQVFRDADVPVELHVHGFGARGNQVGAVTRRLGSGEAVQIESDELGMTEPGLVVVAALPAFDLQRLAQGKLRLKSRVGTGFYIIWRDAAGHVDTMHEWLGASASPAGSRRFYVVFEHAAGRIDQHGVVLMCPLVKSSAMAEARLSVYTVTGKTLGSADAPPLPAMGSRIVHLHELFPRFAEWLAAEGSLGVRISGRNLVEPFSFERQRSGDFHIQHIN